LREYYDSRAPEYDEWYLGLGKFAERDRPGWGQAVRELTARLEALAPARTLDVACGTGFLTQHLPGAVAGLDQSERMLSLARERRPDGEFVQADAIGRLPFDDCSFERVFTGHFYGHLDDAQREGFVTEARRLAPELVVVDSAVRPDHEREEWQERVLNDGSRFQVYKRYFDAAGLLDELGGGEVLYESPWFVAVASRA
jgi:SAM-dependent methyltransferase